MTPLTPATDAPTTAGVPEARGGAFRMAHAEDHSRDPLGFARFLERRVRDTATSAENRAVTKRASNRGASQPAAVAWAEKFRLLLDRNRPTTYRRKERWGDAAHRCRSLEPGTVLAVLDLESVAWRAVTAGRLTATIFRNNRCGALQPAVAASRSSERG